MVMRGVITVINPIDKNQSNKKAVLFYNKLPMSFSEYAYYHIGADYVALCEEADNACVLCRVQNKKEVPVFGTAAHNLITQAPDGSLAEHYVVVIKRDLHNLKEVTVIMEKYGKDKHSYQNMSVFEY